MDAPHVADAHAYVSTRLAPCFASSDVGTPGPVNAGGSAHPHVPHEGASHHVKNSRLNHRSKRSKSASAWETGRDASAVCAEPGLAFDEVSSVALSAARATSASASRFRRWTGITASAAARARLASTSSR